MGVLDVICYAPSAKGNTQSGRSTANLVVQGEHITSIDVNVRTSSQHVEINLSELRGYERHVIVSLINESRAPSDKTMQCDHSTCQGI